MVWSTGWPITKQGSAVSGGKKPIWVIPDKGVHTLELEAPAQCCALTVVEITDIQVKKITVSICNLRSMSVVFV